MIIREFNDEEVKQAKKFVKLLKAKITMWEQAKQRAIKERKNSANKYYKNITGRIKEAEQEINHINEKIAELQEVIKYRKINL